MAVPVLRAERVAWRVAASAMAKSFCKIRAAIPSLASFGYGTINALIEEQ
jgi:hypothetical protein